MLLQVPRNIYSDKIGFSWLVQVAQNLTQSPTSVRLNFKHNQFFDGNLCAVVGALLHQLHLKVDDIVEGDMPPAVLRAISMNDFASAHGGIGMTDEFDTTVKYRRFEFADSKDFAGYLNSELLNKDLPLRDETKRSFRLALVEVFNNSRSHSKAQNGLFSCGQHFPNKEIINYTMVDLGIGFAGTVSNRIGRPIPARVAIPWAVVAGHTSRQDEMGGMGLDEIKSIIERNEGRFQIVSGDGLWEFADGQGMVETMPFAFPGTIVNLQVNTKSDKDLLMEEKLELRLKKDFS